MSREPFNRLVKLAARAFYDDINMKGDNQPKTGRSDNRGMAVVILDALTKRQWVREEDLAKNLKLHTKQLRRTLRFFKEEKLFVRDSRKEIYDVVRYRVHRMKKKLKDQLEDRDMNQKYNCPNCKTAKEVGDGNDRKHRCEHLKDQLQRIEDQLKPLMEQLARVKGISVPEFGSLQAWEARANAAARAENGDPGSGDASKTSQGQGYSGTPMPFLGETRVEVALSGVEAKDDDTKLDPSATTLKVLPPWMIKQGMVLTKEQRGETKQELKEGSSNSGKISDEEKAKGDIEDGEKRRQDEYLKAYYAALMKRQQEQDKAARKNQQELTLNNITNAVEQTSEREVGNKSKREEDMDGVDW